MRKKLFYIVFFVCVFYFFFCNNKGFASEKLNGIENFPDSYKPYLYKLKEKYPNWEFTALYTGIDWNTAVFNEYGNDRNLVPYSYSDNWKCKENGIYNVRIDGDWVNASKNAIEYVMDPRNFLNEVRIFQFEKLTYDENINTEDGVNKILYGTEFYNKTVSYKDVYGSVINTLDTYAKLIMNAGIYSGVSPYHLAARLRQEVGPFLSHKSISGDVPGYEGLYNFYNVGATSSTTQLGAIKNGLQYAKDGKGELTSEEIINQLIPWTTPEKSIKGGAVFIGKTYILVGQNCLYLQKFDVNDDRSQYLFWHQYMTNCIAPYSESKSIYNGYSSMNMLNSSIGFIIPVYNNMPEIPVSSPDILDSDFETDNTKSYANVTTTLNVRTGPGTSYEILTSIPAGEQFTRIAKGVQNGERWDKVKLQNGMIGYIFQTYVAEVIEPEIKEYYFNISTEVKLENNYISNIGNTDINSFLQLIDTNYNLKFYDSMQNKISNESYIGTGYSMQVIDDNNNIINEYKFIVYGDVNGDANINSLDVLVLQKYILEQKELVEPYLQAGNISKDGNLPSALDILKIQKHILEIKYIE